MPRKKTKSKYYLAASSPSTSTSTSASTSSAANAANAISVSIDLKIAEEIKPTVHSASARENSRSYSELLQIFFKKSFGIPCLPADNLYEEDKRAREDSNNLPNYSPTPLEIPDFEPRNVYIHFIKGDTLPLDFLIRETIQYIKSCKGKIRRRRVGIFWETMAGMSSFLINFDWLNDEIDTTLLFATIESMTTDEILKDEKLLEKFRTLYNKINIYFLSCYNFAKFPELDLEAACAFAYKDVPVALKLHPQFIVEPNTIYNEFTKSIVTALKWGRFDFNYRTMFHETLKRFETSLNRMKDSALPSLKQHAELQLKLLSDVLLYRDLNQNLRRGTKTVNTVAVNTAVMPKKVLAKRILDSKADTGINAINTINTKLDSKEAFEFNESSNNASKQKIQGRTEKNQDTAEESLQKPILNQKPIQNMNFDFMVTFITDMHDPNRVNTWLPRALENESRVLWEHFKIQTKLWETNISNTSSNSSNIKKLKILGEDVSSHNNDRTHKEKEYDDVIQLTKKLHEKLASDIKHEKLFPFVFPKFIYQLLLHKDSPKKLIELLNTTEFEISNYLQNITREFKDFLQLLAISSNTLMQNNSIQQKIFKRIISLIKDKLLKKSYYTLAQKYQNNLAQLKQITDAYQKLKVNLAKTTDFNMLIFAGILAPELILRILALKDDSEQLFETLQKCYADATTARVLWEREQKQKIAALEPWYKKPIHFMAEHSFPGSIGKLTGDAFSKVVQYFDLDRQQILLALKKSIRDYSPETRFGNPADCLSEENGRMLFKIMGTGAGIWMSKILLPYWGAEYILTSYIYKDVLFKNLHLPTVTQDLNHASYPSRFHGYSETHYFWGTTLVFTLMHSCYLTINTLSRRYDPACNLQDDPACLLGINGLSFRYEPFLALVGGTLNSMLSLEVIKRILSFVWQLDADGNPEQQLEDIESLNHKVLEDTQRKGILRAETLNTLSQLIYYITRAIIQNRMLKTREERSRYLHNTIKNIESFGMEDCARYSVEIPSIESDYFNVLTFSANAPTRLRCLTNPKAIREVSCMKDPANNIPTDNHRVGCVPTEPIAGLDEVEITEYHSMTQLLARNIEEGDNVGSAGSWADPSAEPNKVTSGSSGNPRNSRNPTAPKMRLFHRNPFS